MSLQRIRDAQALAVAGKAVEAVDCPSEGIGVMPSFTLAGEVFHHEPAVAVLLLASVLMLVASLCACSQKREITNHEVTLKLGESARLTLDKIPEGKTESDYKWNCGLGLSVDGSGFIQANEMGESYVNATLIYKGTEYFEYFEYFKITVPIQMNALSLDQEKGLLLVGQSDALTASPSVEHPQPKMNTPRFLLMPPQFHPTKCHQ